MPRQSQDREPPDQVSPPPEQIATTEKPITLRTLLQAATKGSTGKEIAPSKRPEGKAVPTEPMVGARGDLGSPRATNSKTRTTKSYPKSAVIKIQPAMTSTTTPEEAEAGEEEPVVTRVPRPRPSSPILPSRQKVPQELQDPRRGRPQGVAVPLTSLNPNSATKHLRP